MNKLKVLLDANVLVKILNDYKVSELFDYEDSSEFFASTISFNIISYLWENGRVECTKHDFDNLVNSIIWLNVDQEQCIRSLVISEYNDIEDGLQVACSVSSGMDIMLTYDKKMHSKYKEIITIVLCK